MGRNAAQMTGQPHSRIFHGRDRHARDEAKKEKDQPQNEEERLHDRIVLFA
jgi:hypothetical protein